MTIVERHESPDQMLELEVHFANGDWTIGFTGYPWHTHGDILASWGYKGSPDAATRLFVDDLIASRLIIALYRLHGVIQDVTVPDSYADRPLSKSLLKHAQPGETVELRYWNGRAAVG